ncbi:branched-chain amino acid ABC transporter permease [Gulosibacter sp. 10]|uniref:branched-chain amino acid ABC transporter permease n=1 Tax=Gulosibacter sp. 10 TaxID=1255570 RepID=UPI00097F0456|nr:branched-chain amino acid ABC transporter permease [Gulosibacter sp. 10]SJM60299.1 High-affinity branched-chain amino acid transport system permease protein LivH (TC 3.A.1.4.1) [Gulosibacter sp. 10]
MFVQFIVDAVGLGAFYALLSIGIALLFGVLGLMNFAYGEIILAAAFTLYLCRTLPWPVALLAAIAAGVLVSVLTERLAFRPLRDADPVTLMIASFAVSLILQSVARMTVLPRAQGVPSRSFMSTSFEVLGSRISVLQLVTIALCGITLAGVMLLLQKTSLGAQLRASSENFEMANVLGIRTNVVMISAFAIVGVVGAVSAVVLVGRQGAISAEMGLSPLLIGVVGAVLGGMSNLRGAVLGGLLLGIISAGLEAFLPQQLVPFRDAFLYTLVMAILVVRPQGLLSGEKVRVS